MRTWKKVATVAAMGTMFASLPALAASAAVPLAPYGAIGAEWIAKGGARGFLGQPLDNEYDVAGVPGARTEDFVGGSIYWSPPTGAHEVQGFIFAAYVSTAGGPTVYGLPITDETTTPDGVGRFNHFSNAGSIYWTPWTGAHTVYGSIRRAWAAAGWARGVLGYPTSDEYVTGVPGTRMEYFVGGQMYWSPATGAHEVHGAILVKYLTAAGGVETYGLPLTDETTTPDGTGRFNHFSNGGSIYWTPGTGAHTVYGAIRGAWAAQGWELGRLGYPVTDEYGITGGRQSEFQHGYISWSPLGGTAVHLY
jgi:uncharacterized protein with LGFP repeats